MLVEERGAQAPPSPAAEVPGPHGGEENIFLSMLEKQGSEWGGGCRCRRRRCPLSLGVLRVGRGLIQTPGLGKGLEARAQGVQRPQGAVL